MRQSNSHICLEFANEESCYTTKFDFLSELNFRVYFENKSNMRTC